MWPNLEYNPGTWVGRRGKKNESPQSGQQVSNQARSVYLQNNYNMKAQIWGIPFFKVGHLMCF
jgi:hypothetical protein